MAIYTVICIFGVIQQSFGRIVTTDALVVVQYNNTGVQEACMLDTSFTTADGNCTVTKTSGYN